MKFILVLFSLLLSVSSFAQGLKADLQKSEESSQVQLYPLGMDLRYERGSSQELEDRQFWNFAIAYRATLLSALLESSRFTENSGNTTSNISRTHQEMILWGRWHFWRFRNELVRGSLYGGLGVGAYDEQIKTTLMGESVTDHSGTKILSALAFGGDVSMDLSKDWAVVAALEARTLFAGDFDPNPTGSGVLRVGILVNLN